MINEIGTNKQSDENSDIFLKFLPSPLSEESPKFMDNDGTEYYDQKLSHFDSLQQSPMSKQFQGMYLKSGRLSAINHIIAEEKMLSLIRNTNPSVHYISKDSDEIQFFDSIKYQNPLDQLQLQRCISAPQNQIQMETDNISFNKLFHGPSCQVRMPDMLHFSEFPYNKDTNSFSQQEHRSRSEMKEDIWGENPRSHDISFNLNAISVHQSLYYKTISANHSNQNVQYHADELINIIQDYLDKLSYSRIHNDFVGQSPKSFSYDTASIKIFQSTEIGIPKEDNLINDTLQKIIKRTFELLYPQPKFITVSPMIENRQFFHTMIDQQTQEQSPEFDIKEKQEQDTQEKDFNEIIHNLQQEIELLKQEVDLLQTKCSIGDCRMMEFYDNEQKAKKTNQSHQNQIKDLQQDNQKVQKVNMDLTQKVKQLIDQIKDQSEEIISLKISFNVQKQKYGTLLSFKEQSQQNPCSIIINEQYNDQQTDSRYNGKLVQSYNQLNLSQKKIHQIKQSASISLSPYKVSRVNQLNQENPTYVKFVSARTINRLRDLKTNAQSYRSISFSPQIISSQQNILQTTTNGRIDFVKEQQVSYNQALQRLSPNHGSKLISIEKSIKIARSQIQKLTSNTSTSLNSPEKKQKSNSKQELDNSFDTKYHIPQKYSNKQFLPPKNLQSLINNQQIDRIKASDSSQNILSANLDINYQSSKQQDPLIRFGQTNLRADNSKKGSLKNLDLNEWSFPFQKS